MSTTDLSNNTPEGAIARCGDCEWQGEAESCLPIRDFGERVAPGEEVPVGECPDCGALCHLVGVDFDDCRPEPLHIGELPGDDGRTIRDANGLTVGRLYDPDYLVLDQTEWKIAAGFIAVFTELGRDPQEVATAVGLTRDQALAFMRKVFSPVLTSHGAV